MFNPLLNSPGVGETGSQTLDETMFHLMVVAIETAIFDPHELVIGTFEVLVQLTEN